MLVPHGFDAEHRQVPLAGAGVRHATCIAFHIPFICALAAPYGMAYLPTYPYTPKAPALV